KNVTSKNGPCDHHRSCTCSPIGRNGFDSTCKTNATNEATDRNITQWKMIRRASAPCTFESIKCFVRRGFGMCKPSRHSRPMEVRLDAHDYCRMPAHAKNECIDHV